MTNGPPPPEPDNNAPDKKAPALDPETATGPQPVPPPPPRRHRPEDAAPTEGDRAYGVEYLILGAILIGLTFAFSPRARKLIELLYDPFVIILLLVIFTEYLILKARDRTYVLEREVELQRRKRRELEHSLDECRQVLDEIIPPESAQGSATGPPSSPDSLRAPEKSLARARQLRDRLNSIR